MHRNKCLIENFMNFYLNFDHLIMTMNFKLPLIYNNLIFKIALFCYNMPSFSQIKSYFKAVELLFKSDFDFEIILNSSQSQTQTFDFDYEKTMFFLINFYFFGHNKNDIKLFDFFLEKIFWTPVTERKSFLSFNSQNMKNKNRLNNHPRYLILQLRFFDMALKCCQFLRKQIKIKCE
ncbi:hypothetical protein BpHYR1_024576 [Brachionus plicatilis]|uniref:Uncharacterized protein n=1 Tax=Brachionus plicatilis TaxID=10195 RepID=A0A3M7R003_BRAPC|nr:hypothetical protein BpHYR1_024576 [Brachionus plicatilis]